MKNFNLKPVKETFTWGECEVLPLEEYRKLFVRSFGEHIQITRSRNGYDVIESTDDKNGWLVMFPSDGISFHVKTEEDKKKMKILKSGKTFFLLEVEDNIEFLVKKIGKKDVTLEVFSLEKGGVVHRERKEYCRGYYGGPLKWHYHGDEEIYEGIKEKFKYPLQEEIII